MSRDAQPWWPPSEARPRLATAGLPPLLRGMIADGAPDAVAVRLRMRGEIRLGRWRPFSADEVLHRDRGFSWRARTGLITGSDELLDGVGRARWRLLGLLTVMRGEGADVTRSCIGRWLAEAIWLPTMLLPAHGAAWAGDTVALERHGQRVRLAFDAGADQGIAGVRLRRWGQPVAGAPFGEHGFGAIVEERRRFGAFTIPSRVRVGWHPGEGGWAEGEFFRATVEGAEFR